MRLSLIAPAAVLLGSASAKSLSQALISHGSLSMLHDLLKDLGLLEKFQTAERSTILAMTDDALIGLANWGLNMSTIDPALARAILEYHFLEGVFTSSDPLLKTDVQLAHSLLRPPILTNVTDGPVVKLSIIDDSLSAESGIQKVMQINESDITHDNGVLHTIDSNLVLPHNLSETTNLGNLYKFWDLVERSKSREILEAMKDVTVFLPDDNAVRQWSSALGSLTPEQLATVVANHAIPNRVLYHSAFSAGGNEYKTLSGMRVTVSGDSRGNIFINEAKILKKDVLIFGGVAHILDGVLVPSRHRGKFEVKSKLFEPGWLTSFCRFSLPIAVRQDSGLHGFAFGFVEGHGKDVCRGHKCLLTDRSCISHDKESEEQETVGILGVDNSQLGDTSAKHHR